VVDERNRFQKIIAVAVNPGAQEPEAIAALRRARQLVRQNPELAHPPTPEPVSAQKKPEASFKAKITDISNDWIAILMGLLSKCAHTYGLLSRFDVEFRDTGVDLNVLVEGTSRACTDFELVRARARLRVQSRALSPGCLSR